MILAQIKENCSNTVCRGWVKCVFYLRRTLSVTARIKFVMFSAWTWSFSLRSSVLLNNRFSVLIIRSSSAYVWLRESLLQSIVIFYPLFFMRKKKTVLLLHWHNEGPEIKTSKLCFQKSPIYGYSGCKKIFAILGIFPQGLDLKRWHIAWCRI